MQARRGNTLAWKTRDRSAVFLLTPKILTLFSLRCSDTSMVRIPIAVFTGVRTVVQHGKKFSTRTMIWVRLISHSIPLTHKRSMRACGTFVVHHGLSMLRQMVLVQVSSNQTTVETLGHNSQTACRLKVSAE